MTSHDEIWSLLQGARTIAVVGCSPKPERDSHRVALYLQQAGYRIVPINPGAAQILGETAYPDLESVPVGVQLDIVDVFRSPEHIPPIAEAAIARGVPALWLQLGCANREAEDRARAAGLQVVSDRCIKIEHRARFASAQD